MSTSHEFLYFTDPMCSWCYGFAPEITRLQQNYEDRIPVQMVLGGLRPDETRAMPEATAKEIAHHWEAVQGASGQPFDDTFFEKHPGFVYNTTPASRAVVAAGRMSPARPLEFQSRLQRLFYAQAEDPTQPETFEKAAAAMDIDPAEFRAKYEDPETEDILRSNFNMSRSFGIGGFPTLVLRETEDGEDKYILICRGYMKFEDIRNRVEQILNKEVDLVPSGGNE